MGFDSRGFLSCRHCIFVCKRTGFIVFFAGLVMLLWGWVSLGALHSSKIISCFLGFNTRERAGRWFQCFLSHTQGKTEWIRRTSRYVLRIDGAPCNWDGSCRLQISKISSYWQQCVMKNRKHVLRIIRKGWRLLKSTRFETSLCYVSTEYSTYNHSIRPY